MKAINPAPQTQNRPKCRLRLAPNAAFITPPALKRLRTCRSQLQSCLPCLLDQKLFARAPRQMNLFMSSTTSVASASSASLPGYYLICNGASLQMCSLLLFRRVTRAWIVLRNEMKCERQWMPCAIRHPVFDDSAHTLLQTSFPTSSLLFQCSPLRHGGCFPCAPDTPFT